MLRDSCKSAKNIVVNHCREVVRGIPTAITAYSLRQGSPAILAGSAVSRRSERDFAGRRIRVMDGRVDRGAVTWKPAHKSDTVK